ncbi:cytidine deaminase [bacterium]|nr:cytidine deaminase [bacterium]
MHKNIQGLLIAARDARKSAYAPYSGFKVGAAVLCGSGKVYTGCNVENASYGLSMCAERVAVQKAVSEGERHIKAVAIVTDGDGFARPCGACLQVIAEFSDKDNPAEIISGNLNLEYDVFGLGDYLPKPFNLRQ